MTDAESRFWDKVDVGDDDECWMWTAGTRGNGYGAFCYEGKNHYPHRLVIYFVDGYYPSGDETACHFCDEPLCVNPRHIFVATHAENAFDASVKGRAYSPSGADHGQSKLSDEDVCTLRQDFIDEKATVDDLASRFDVTAHYVEQIIRHENRSDIDGSPPPVAVSDSSLHGSGRTLSIKTVRSIRDEYDPDKQSYADVAENYDVSGSTVGSIIRRDTYSDV